MRLIFTEKRLFTGGQTTLASRRPSIEAINAAGGATGGSDKDKDDTDVQDGRLSVFVHKRDDQSSHEVIQPLLRYHRNHYITVLPGRDSSLT